MKTFYALTLATLIGFAVPAYADDVGAKAPARGQTTLTARQPSPVKVSQQDKMELCAKEATGKTGAERKGFIKSCLSKKA